MYGMYILPLFLPYADETASSRKMEINMIDFLPKVFYVASQGHLATTATIEILEDDMF